MVNLLFFVFFFLFGCEEVEGFSEEGVFEFPDFPDALLFDNFQNGVSSWSVSECVVNGERKYGGVVESGVSASSVVWNEDDLGLLLPKAGAFYGVVRGARDVVSFDSPSGVFVLQYEVQFERSLECGGAYVKLPASAFCSASSFCPDSPYGIMFGPDKCGSTDKVHLIFQTAERHAETGEVVYMEHHLANPPRIRNDEMTHLYALHLHMDTDSFCIFIDTEEVVCAGLLDEGVFDPPFQPPKQIDDPEDTKPDDWVDDMYIDDPEAQKPEDWDEDAPEFIIDEDDEKPEEWDEDAPLLIPDHSVQKPEEWDDEEDGVWEAPLIENPECEKSGCGEWRPRLIPNPMYKGKWSAPQVENPAYVGEWSPAQIANPLYDGVVSRGFSRVVDVCGVAVDVWLMTANVFLDNILLSDDVEGEVSSCVELWRLKHAAEEEKKPKTASLEVGEGGALLQQIRETLSDIPLPVVVAIALIVLSTILLLFCCKRTPPLPHDKEEDGEEEQEEQEGESEEEEEDEGESEEEEKKRRRKKKKSKYIE